MATYLEMQSRIAGELNRSNLTAEIKLAILSAITYHEKRRWWFNEEITATLVTVAATGSIDLPTDLIELEYIQITTGSTYILRQVDEREIVTMRQGAGNGKPTHFALYNNRIRLFPIPDAVYALTAHYIQSLAVLALDADTNAWTTEAEELIRIHAKKDLYVNKIHDTNKAKDMQAMEDSILLRLESLNQRRTTTGRTKARYL